MKTKKVSTKSEKKEFNRIVMIDKAVTITSSITKEQYETVLKQSPSSLQVLGPMDECGYQDSVFYVGLDTSRAYGEIDGNGIIFPGTDKAGRLQISKLLPANVKDLKKYLFDEYSVVMNYLTIIEESVKTALDNYVVSQEKFVEGIVVLDEAEEAVELEETEEEATE